MADPVMQHISKELMLNIADQNERLRELLKHADEVVIWEDTPARPGFQKQIDAALTPAKET